MTTGAVQQTYYHEDFFPVPCDSLEGEMNPIVHLVASAPLMALTGFLLAVT